MVNILTPSEVSDLVGIAVDVDDIALAQLVVETVGDLDLGVTYLATYSESDVARIHEAICWELIYLQSHPEVVSQVGNVLQASANGASLTFRSGDNGALAPLAARSLSRLSWRRSNNGVQVSTLYAGTADRRVQPDPWILVSTGGSL